MNLKGKSVLVTGGASGLGEATVTRLLQAGAKIVSVDLDEDRGIESAQSAGVIFYQADVRDVGEISGAFEVAKNAHGAVQVLVNAAGYAAPFRRTFGRQGPFPLDEFQNVIDINLVGSFNCARLAAEQMVTCEAGRRGERGVIINVASINAFDGPVGTVAYTAAKAGVHGMTITMARDLARYGIRVCTIAPGSFDTPMLRDAMPGRAEQLLDSVPFPNDALGAPGDFANLVEHICGNPMLNGETIRLDGAARLAFC